MRHLKTLTLSIIICITTTCRSNTISLDPELFEQTLKQTANPQLIDVRTFSEYAQGYLPGALLMDIRKPASFDSLISQLDKDRPVFVYCRIGRRSMDAAKILEKKNHKVVYNLEGGILMWLEKGKEVAVIR